MTVDVRDLGLRLFIDFSAWLVKNKNKIPAKWYVKLRKHISKIDVSSPASVAGAALWAFNIVANLGVAAIITRDGFVVYDYNGFDEDSTNSLLSAIVSALRCASGSAQ